MNNKIKLIALDLDNTLLTHKKEVTERTRKALKAASDLGVRIVFSTGRYYDMIPDAAKELEFVDHAICINGAEIYDIKNKKILYDKRVKASTALEIMEYLDTIDVIYDAYIDDKGYVSEDMFQKIYDDRYISSDYYRTTFERYRTTVPDLKTFIRECGKDIQKFQFFSQNYDTIKKGSEYIKTNYPQCTVSTSMINNTEINGENVSKGNSLKILADILGIKIEETMAVGDGGNDIEMLKTAGFAVAMGNSIDEVKEIADFITYSNNDDGVAYAVEKYVLNT